MIDYRKHSNGGCRRLPLTRLTATQSLSGKSRILADHKEASRIERADR